MKVAKFGGSSLSSATQIKKVANIIQNDSNIRYVVVSAPGKRETNDIKVTDLLIDLHRSWENNQPVETILQAILTRFASIISDLELNDELLIHFETTLNHYLTTIHHSERLLDALKSCGEDFNAQLISRYLQKIGMKARYISPKELGIIVSDEPSNAQLLPESYAQIARFRRSSHILIIPGFFGYSKQGEIVTFPRGGSDITGAIVTRGVHADIYENFTDQSYIYAAHPNIVQNPYAIKEITYREMRELAYSGFGIFHDEALEPLFKVEIPVMVRNTNHPEIPGTKIVAKRQYTKELPVVGISCDEGFTAITLRKYLLNRQVGFVRKLLQIFENHNVSIEHIPTGIDDISIVIRSHYLQPTSILKSILHDIKHQLHPDSLEVEENLAIIVVVGEGMASSIGMANTATHALSQEKINIRMINQGASEISMFFTITMSERQRAIKAMYEAYFSNIPIQ